MSENTLREDTALDALKTHVEKLERENQSLSQELTGTSKFLQNILDTSSSISIVSTDLDHNILYWNTGAENLFGYTADEVVGKQKMSILYPDDRSSRKAVEGARDFITSVKAGATCDVVEKTKDGRELWVKLTLMPRLDLSGAVVGIIGIGQDITDLKHTEKKLEYSLRKLRRAVGGTIHAMALTVEKRDPYTAGHQRRATDLARAIADEMKLPKDTIDGIRMAGVIHDLGKLYVPADILNKPGRLTKDEFNLIKRHPEAGYDIIKYVEFPWPIGQIVLQHHERIDGTGYPQGLRGDQICMEARVIAVADVVESMASHRPYRPALGIERALAEVQSHSGALYDELVVASCVRLLREGRYVLKAKEEESTVYGSFASV